MDRREFITASGTLVAGLGTGVLLSKTPTAKASLAVESFSIGSDSITTQDGTISDVIVTVTSLPSLACRQTVSSHIRDR